MSGIKHYKNVSYVKGHVKVNLRFAKYGPRFAKAQEWLGKQVLADSKLYMPLKTGSLQQRSYVTESGRQVVFPGPYARYLYMGKVMVDPETGSPWARKGAVKVVTDRDLRFSTGVPNTEKTGRMAANGSSWGNQMVDTKDFSTILSGLLNDFPAIGARKIRFGELGDKSGVGIYPSAAATVISETTDIMGGVYQKCNYAFQVVYRAVPQSETDRIHIKGWLDKLARWLEKQPITADGQQHTLAAWPDLGDGRTITAFVQVSAAYLAGRYADGVEDWAVSLSMRYDNNFER